jgi:glycosyltransferase involved in cell wall biosynthesis
MASINSHVLLTIAIPTYNRSEQLKETLLSIVGQRRFQATNDVEIVISDNASTDETRLVSLSFVEIYGEKIRYSRNETNLLDLNFEKSLSLGKGEFLKLNNDTLKHNDGSLDSMLRTIEENRPDKKILLFTNGLLDLKGKTLCENLDSFIGVASFQATWIGCFGIWKSDFDSTKDFSRRAHLKLIQTDNLFRLVLKKPALIINERLCASVPFSKKGDYDLLTIFLDNYIFLLAERLNNKELSEKTYYSEKRKLLLQFICPCVANIKMNPERFSFECKDIDKRIADHYKDDRRVLVAFQIRYHIAIVRIRISRIRKHIIKAITGNG